MDRELQLETCRVDLDRRLVIRDGDETPLTEQEAALLEYLAARPGQAVARDELLIEVWGFHSSNLITRAIDVAVRRLRTKIERDPGRPTHVITVRHVGYRFSGGSARTVEPAEPRATAPPRSALPHERTSFHGREVDLAGLSDALGTHRWVTLTGPPGVGKTRLAVRQGHRLEAAGRPVAWVELGSAGSAGDLVQRVASALGIPLPPEADAAARSDQLERALGERGGLLLALDNLDALADEAAGVQRWLDGAPELRVLATSRQRLRVDGEQIIALEPLDHPTAVALFLERARAAQRGYGADEPAVVDRIVEELDRLPLAIELAAARASILSPTALLDGMQQRFRLLVGAGRGATTLHGALDWSWSHLEPYEQRAMAQLSVFEGSFSAELAEEVVALPPGAPWVLDWLQGLVDKSLLRAIAGDEQARFELLRSQRAFARERLGGDEAVLVRHRDAVLAHGEARVAELDSAGGRRALTELNALVDDLRAVHERSLGSDPEGTVRSAQVLDALFEITGPPEERAAVIEAGLRAAATDGDRARLLLARARVRSLRAEHEAAVGDTERAAALATDPGLRARIATHRAWLHEQHSSYDEARTEALRALELAVRAGDPLAGAWAQNRLGHLAALTEDLPAAERHYREMRAAAEQLGSWSLEVRARMNLGLVARTAGRKAEAEHEYRRALELARAAGDRGREAAILGNLAALAASEGAISEAVELFEHSFRGHRALGNRRLETQALGNYGILLMADGRLREARSRLVEATALADRHDSPRHLGMMEGNLGVCQVQLGEVAAARLHLERAVELLGDWGSPFSRAYFGLHLAIVRADLDDLDGAEALVPGLQALGDGPIATGLREVARAHVRLARSRSGGGAGDHAEAVRAEIEQIEAVVRETRGQRLANALNAVLPSELEAALRNLRRAAEGVRGGG